MKHLRALSLFALTLCFALSALAQTAETPTKESAGLKKMPAAPGPIVINWKMKKLDGTANLVVNSDGSWIFSGDVKDKKKDRDFDVAVALKSTLGSAVMFHFVGNASDGVQWSKEGQSTILKDDFKNFAKGHWTAAWTIPLDSEGRKKAYEAEEAKKKKLKAEELAKEQKEEAAKAQAAQQSSGGGGSSVLSTIGTVAGVVGTILAFL